MRPLQICRSLWSWIAGLQFLIFYHERSCDFVLYQAVQNRSWLLNRWWQSNKYDITSALHFFYHDHVTITLIVSLLSSSPDGHPSLKMGPLASRQKLVTALTWPAVLGPFTNPILSVTTMELLVTIVGPFMNPIHSVTTMKLLVTPYWGAIHESHPLGHNGALTSDSLVGPSTSHNLCHNGAVTSDCRGSLHESPPFGHNGAVTCDSR